MVQFSTYVKWDVWIRHPAEVLSIQFRHESGAQGSDRTGSRGVGFSNI